MGSKMGLLKQDLKEMLDAQKKSIVDQLKVDNQKKFAKLDKRINNFETSLNQQMLQFKEQLKQPNPGNPNEAATVDVMDDSSAGSDPDDIATSGTSDDDLLASSFERRKIYDIMCMVFEKDVSEGDKDFEKDERFIKIIKKLYNDEKYFQNDYNAHNRNLSLIRDLSKRFQKNNFISFQDPE
jgi:hypothetical protein